MKKRLEPFAALLDARYTPLLFLVLPQAFTVFLWLATSVPKESEYASAAFVFAIIGAIGFEFTSVGAIAWAETNRVNLWSRVTAIISLVFSMLIAYHVYQDRPWALLHTGNALVSFCYTLSIFSKSVPPVISSDDSLSLAQLMKERGCSYREIAKELQLPLTAVFRLLNTEINALQPTNGLEH